MYESGNISTCPEGRVDVHQAVNVISQALGYRVPWLGAFALHHAAHGSAGQLDLMLENVDPSVLRAVLLSGGTGLLPVIAKATMLLQVRRKALAPEAQKLLSLCAILGHVPLDAAHQMVGRETVDVVLNSGMGRRHSCGDTQTITMASPILERHWQQSLTGFELLELENEALKIEKCCMAGLPHTVSSALARDEEHQVEAVVEALNVASESQNPSQGEAAALFVRQSLPQIKNSRHGICAAVALARYSYVRHGSHAALRELKRGSAQHAGLWNSAETAQLLVQICLETGRLLPTLQRVATLRGLEAPLTRDDPAILELLPQDSLSRKLKAALEASKNANMRTAAIHMVSGLRMCSGGEPSNNAVALRGTLLSATGIYLAMGGYAQGLRMLSEYLHRHPSPWHARSIAALELSQGLRELQQGKLFDGAQSLELAAQSAILIDAESVHCSIQDIDQVVTRFSDFPALEKSGVKSGVAMSLVFEGRHGIEDIATAGLLRDPATQRLLLEHLSSLSDPRAQGLKIRARSQLGLCDPIVAIDTLLLLDQGFDAAWVADGVIMSHVFEHCGPEKVAEVHSLHPLEPMEIVRTLLTPLGTKPVPGVSRELLNRLSMFESQTLPSLPFLAHELRARTLTPREEEISKLARAGMNNRQIARELTLSIRTIEGHIAAALGKLSLDRREELLLETGALDLV
ncbi:hypothetical protein CQ018_01975 [Arthrobacter sp. MYb227]|nr:hypothetical protein CQ018_01975 [Arthrobacter sp. MYb227]